MCSGISRFSRSPSCCPSRPRLQPGTRFRADAGKPGGWSAEWADVSCASDSRVTQVKSPVAQGRRAYRLRVQEGDDSYGERCEIGMANTSSSNIDRVGGSRVLFHNGTESWIAQQIMLDPNVYAFCETECPLDYDGGLVQQLKQTGACGTPANGIVTRDLPGVGVVPEHRNSAENDCRQRDHEVAVESAGPPWSVDQDSPARALVHRSAPVTSPRGSTAGRCSRRVTASRSASRARATRFASTPGR